MTDNEAAIYLEEIIYLLEQGHKVPQVADKLKWPESDVLNLLRSDLGRQLLAESEKAEGSFELEEGDLTMAEARSYAKQRLPGYIKQLDHLSQKAQSEQVRLNALQGLLKITGATDEVKDEIVEIPDFLVKNLAEAISEALAAKAKS
jgi:hypothetical protein